VIAASVVGAAIVLSVVAFVLRAQPAVQEFMAQYPGVVEPAAGAPVGIPVWVNVTHFLNTLFLLLIIRTALSIRSKKRPPAFWTPRRKLFGQAPRRMGINVWLHNTVDILWVLNGAIYLVLLFATGQWVRTVPTSWEVFPHALSALLQYLTFTWPVENPWVSYNALQVLAYFGVTFLLAPLAILSGVAPIARLATRCAAPQSLGSREARSLGAQRCSLSLPRVHRGARRPGSVHGRGAQPQRDVCREMTA
jgi:thiosulfate reductase cytochrome b subunit